MLRRITEDANGITIKYNTIETDTLPTFAGVSMTSLDNIIRRPIGEELTGDKIIIGDETNIIKDSLVSVDGEGNINLPLDTGVFINSQPILFQDNADSSMYKVEVDKAIIGTLLNTNNINNVTALDNMVIQGDGEIKIKTSKLGAGTKLIGKSGNPAQIAICNDNNENKRLVLGYDSVNDRGVIAVVDAGVVIKNLELGATGSIILTDAELKLQKTVNPLVFQHAGTGFTTVINTTQPTDNRLYNFPDVSADADVILSQGAQTKTGSLTLASQLICQSSAVIRSNGANGHIITSGTAPASAFNHFLQLKTETLAELDDVIYFNVSCPNATPWGATTGTFNYMTYLAGVGFSRLDAVVEVDVGTTGTLNLIDSLNSQTIATLTFARTTGAPLVASTTTFSNLPVASSMFEFNRVVVEIFT
jgi:hypothetical protein